MVIGIDEAGRGPCAGPLVAAAVALQRPLAGLADSKKLSPSRRRQLAQVIKAEAAGVGIAWVSSSDIDAHGLSWAQTRAMTIALEQITAPADQIILDGRYNYLAEISNTQAIIGADNRFPAVMAASIIAKVSRDNFMVSLANLYPSYGLDKHKGYCTPHHLQMIARHGPVRTIHRLSYKPLAELVSINQ